MNSIGRYKFNRDFAEVSGIQFYGDDPSVKSVMDLLDTVKDKKFRTQLLRDLGIGVSMLIRDEDGVLYTVRPGSIVFINAAGNLRVMTCRDFSTVYSLEEEPTDG